MKKRLYLLILAAVLSLNLLGCKEENEQKESQTLSHEIVVGDEVIPPFTGDVYVEVNDNVPEFSEEEEQESEMAVSEPVENYGELDDKGRCTEAFAVVCQEIMPTEDRESIGEVRPSGWHTVKYNGIVEGNYLYNRSHLIGFQLAGENANPKNLITGTRYFNADGMLPFENMVADYVHETDNHVAYKVTPVFEGDNLVASGVQMQGLSLEDQGEGVCFNVFVYNVQPGIAVDYATGDSWIDPDIEVDGISIDTGDYVSDGNESEKQPPESEQAVEQEYVLNTGTRKFHDPSCDSVQQMKSRNRDYFTGTRDELISQGYEPCGSRKP